MPASATRGEIDAFALDADRAARAIARSDGGAEERDGSNDRGASSSARTFRWIARSGDRVRGRARISVAKWALEAVSVDRVTVEWSGTERARDGTERVVSRSPPGEVARRAVVEPGRRATFVFGIDLPPGLAPTFSGEWTGYAYRVSVRATLANGDEVEASAPLIVRSSGESWSFGEEEEGSDEEEEQEGGDAKKRHDLAAPWIHVEDAVPPESPRFRGSLPSPRALTPFQMWGDVETPRAGAPLSPWDGGSSSAQKTPLAHTGRGPKPKVYVVSSGDERVLKVTLRRPAPKCTIGGELAGILDFTCAQLGGLRASEVKISLESNEILHAEAKTAPDRKPPVFRKVWVQTSESVEHLDTSHFVLNLPLNSPGSFRTSHVELKWLLRFEITCVTRTRAGEFAAFFKGEKERKEYSTLDWVLPLEVGSDWFATVAKAAKTENSTTLRRESSLVAMPY